MLVSCRRAGQSIRIGDDIEITVLDITPSKVRLGITAPAHVRVTRGEVLLIQEENAAASCPPARVEAALRDRLKTSQPPGAKDFSCCDGTAR